MRERHLAPFLLAATLGSASLGVVRRASAQAAAPAPTAAPAPAPAPPAPAPPAAPSAPDAAAPSAPDAAAPEVPGLAPAILSLAINGAPRGDVYLYLGPVLDGPAGQRDVFLRADDLAAAGLGALRGTTRRIEGVDYLSLASMRAAVRVTVDEKELALRLEVDPAALPLTRIGLGHSEAPADMRLGDDLSLFLNYAASGTAAQGRSRTLGADAYFETGVSRGPWLLYGSAMVNLEDQARGLTNLTYDDRAALRRFVVGDSVAAGDNLGGSAIFGGVQLARSFELDPYRVFRPTLGQTGVARTPSTAEIYVNGVLVKRAELPPGPFSATDLPATTGAGETRVVVRDALGREQTYASSYYLPANLLTPGISEYSYTLGYRRRQLGTESWDYAAPALVAQHRLGLARWLTGGLRFEAGRQLASGGPSLALGLPIGELTVAAAASVEDARAGAALALGYLYSGRRVSLGVLARALTDEYATVSLDPEDERTVRELGASLGVPVAPRISLTAQATYQRARDLGRNDRAAVTASINLTHSWQLAISGSVTRDAERELRVGAFAGLTMVIDPRTTATASQRVEHRQAARGAVPGGAAGAPDSNGAESAVELQRTLATATGYGYRLRGRVAPEGDAQGEATVELQGARGRLTTTALWDGVRANGRVGVAGGVVLIGGRVFATRPVQRGYALLRVPGAKGVRGYLDNQLVGTTDARGDLVVPNLLPYYANRLAIDETDLPLDTILDRAEQRVASRNRGGVVVRFAAVRMRAVRGSIVIDGDARSAAYGELRLLGRGDGAAAPGDGERAPGPRGERDGGAAPRVDGVSSATADPESWPVGSEGQFELANLPPGRHRAQLEYEGGSCTISLEISERGQPIEDLGPLPCTPPTEARR